MRYLLERARSRVWVAARGDALVAAAIVLLRRNSRVARLYSIAVDAAARGRGLGAELLTVAERDAAALGNVYMRAEIRCSNAGSLALFRQAGYRTVAALPGYYPGPAGTREDGVRMEKRLPAGEPASGTYTD